MYVFSKVTTRVAAPGGGTTGLYEGEAWDADDAVVKAHPDCFSSEPTKIRRSPGPVRVETTPVVEDATAEPGTKRRTTKRQ